MKNIHFLFANKMSEIVQISETFTKSYTEFVAQDSLCTIITGDLNKIRFIMYTVRMGFQTEKQGISRFHPNPIQYFKHMYDEDLTNEDIDVFVNYMSKHIEGFISAFFHQGKFRFNRDSEIVEILQNVSPIGMKFVKLLYFFIFTNTISFKSVNIPSLAGKGYLFIVSHDEMKEKEFYNIENGADGKILFHGTRISNVYSIMRNGIKTMSGSKFMSSGSAYGSGVYLTHNINTAFGYGTDLGKICDFDADPSETSTCILIFDVKNLNPQGGDYCYVQQENEIILRAIFWCQKFLIHNDAMLSEELISYGRKIRYVPPKEYISKSPPKRDNVDILISAVQNINLNNSNESTKGEILPLSIKNMSGNPMNSDRVISSLRFKKEISKLREEIESGNFIIKQLNFAVPGDQKSPLLCLIGATSDSKLQEDLDRHNIPGILVAFHFTDGQNLYPQAPPKVRVISPIFKRQTGRVTEGGSICTDLLYDSWSPSVTIRSICISISDLLSNDGINESGRIDDMRLNEEYSYAMYEMSFSRTAQFHGFKAIS